MLYFDSSVLVCLLSQEARTDQLQQWFSTLDPGELCVSPWNITEFYSAMSFKRRTQHITDEEQSAAEKLFENYLTQYFIDVPVEASDFRRAAAVAGRVDINLRAPDALHLAVAEANRAIMCTLDKKMQLAADAIGVACLIP